jgi:hypothetical protein
VVLAFLVPMEQQVLPVEPFQQLQLLPPAPVADFESS